MMGRRRSISCDAGPINAGAPRPDLIVLDLNLPKRNGFEVLTEIKLDADLRQIAVVVFSSSTSDSDVKRAYDCHANCYVGKPSHLDALFRVAQALEAFWLRTARLAPPAPALADAHGMEGAD